MANRECVRCHRFFERVAFEEVCPVCFPIEEEEFRKIKEYLTVHPGASSNEVMSVIGVSLKSIRRYLKEERLEIVGDNKGFIRCELCGRPLNSGRFCDGCYKEGQALRAKGFSGSLGGPFDKYGEETREKSKKGILYREKS
ncbi:MAG: hypothetical protein GX227_07935 [Clostridiaceae bacterium]|jgi:hypothetical protein|nr:hypothetical protein [Clostridiaceae bacterium]